MAEATKFENARALVDGSTMTGPAIFRILLTAGSADAVLTLSYDGGSLAIAAKAGTSICPPATLKLGGSIAATISLTGTGATAYAIDEVD